MEVREICALPEGLSTPNSNPKAAYSGLTLPIAQDELASLATGDKCSVPVLADLAPVGERDIGR